MCYLTNVHIGNVEWRTMTRLPFTIKCHIISPQASSPFSKPYLPLPHLVFCLLLERTFNIITKYFHHHSHILKRCSNLPKLQCSHATLVHPLRKALNWGYGPVAKPKGAAETCPRHIYRQTFPPTIRDGPGSQDNGPPSVYNRTFIYLKPQS